jgi:hypothetical protein
VALELMLWLWELFDVGDVVAHFGDAALQL